MDAYYQQFKIFPNILFFREMASIRSTVNKRDEKKGKG
jgi:hypothetical protein